MDRKELLAERQKQHKQCTKNIKDFLGNVIDDQSFVESNEFFALEQDKREIYLLKKWTEKEAYFKACNSDVFRPSEYDSSSLSVIGESICIDGKDYYYSVFSDTPQKLRKFVVDDIERI